MSMCKLNTVTSSRDERTCLKCGGTIAKGDGYRWWKGRYTDKRVRCMKASCTPRPWERETNTLRASPMQAESLVSSVQSSEDDPEGMATDLQQALDLIQEVIDDLDNRLFGWQGTGLENSQQYESCDTTKYELESWLSTAEMVVSELEAIDVPEATEDDEADQEAAEQLTADIELALSSLEDIPELDLGA
jgi:hypothetical protein